MEALFWKQCPECHTVFEGQAKCPKCNHLCGDGDNYIPLNVYSINELKKIGITVYACHWGALLR